MNLIENFTKSLVLILSILAAGCSSTKSPPSYLVERTVEGISIVAPDEGDFAPQIGSACSTKKWVNDPPPNSPIKKYFLGMSGPSPTKKEAFDEAKKDAFTEFSLWTGTTLTFSKKSNLTQKQNINLNHIDYYSSNLTLKSQNEINFKAYINSIKIEKKCITTSIGSNRYNKGYEAYVLISVNKNIIKRIQKQQEEKRKPKRIYSEIFKKTISLNGYSNVSEAEYAALNLLRKKIYDDLLKKTSRIHYAKIGTRSLSLLSDPEIVYKKCSKNDGYITCKAQGATSVFWKDYYE